MLDLIRRHNPISRVELAPLSGLSSGALVRISRELILRDLVEIGETVGGNRGQPRQPLLINPRGAFSIGAAFYPKQLDIAITNFAGVPIAQESHAFDDLDPAGTAKLAWRFIRRMIKARKSLNMEKCLGIGLAVPGYLTSHQASLRTVEELKSWRDVDMSAIFEVETGLPTWVENIASAGALTELYRPTKSDPRHIVFLHIGYGVGAGIIISGELYRGRGGNAGEVGVFFPGDGPRPSGLDFLNMLNASRAERYATLSDIDFESVSREATVQDWIVRVAHQISDLAKTAKYWLAPDEFVVGGPFPNEILDQVTDRLRPHVNLPDEEMPAMKIRTSKAGPRTTAIGAALLPIHYTCSPAISGIGD
ncbi:MAG: ROK family transcriptional regulator [Henriciella sp.]